MPTLNTAVVLLIVHPHPNDVARIGWEPIGAAIDKGLFKICSQQVEYQQILGIMLLKHLSSSKPPPPA